MDPDRRWLFGDQLGPHFLDGPDQPVLMVESMSVLGAHRYHRAKLHLVLSAMRHRAAELGERCDYRRASSFAAGVEEARVAHEKFSTVHPTSRSSLAAARALTDEVLAPRGFCSAFEDFTAWAEGRTSLRMEEFYRAQRRRLGVLMRGGDPEGGRWNFDSENRTPPPRGQSTLSLSEPWSPTEDGIDEEVRADLDSWERDGTVRSVGRDDVRRFAVTRAEAMAALDHFLRYRLRTFGSYEDAMMSGDWTMSHSLLSVPLNLGLLHPLEVVDAAVLEYQAGRAPLNAVEGLVRQLIGWRDYTWHTYWQTGPDYTKENALDAREPLPEWWEELDPSQVDAACMADVLTSVRDHGWTHHIPRLMVLGSWALQRGLDPAALNNWFRRVFVDGFTWVMPANVIGMSQYADGGRVATKPYTSGGAYIDRMSDYCGQCPYSPKVRTGPDACPFTAGYWAFLDRHRPRFAGNHRMKPMIGNLDRLKDLPLVRQEVVTRGTAPP